MIKLIDNFLNRITMYRLVLYFLMLLVAVAAVLSALGILPYNALAPVGSALFLVVVCWAVNLIFARTFKAPANVESVYITALILALIIRPAGSVHDLVFLFWAGTLAMGLKYIVAIGKKHLFNPAALAVVITAFALGRSATWWVGTAWMLPFVAVGGILVVRKIRRFDLVYVFLLTALAASFIFAFLKGSDVIVLARQALLDSPLFFFAFIMLTEPLTTPPTQALQVWYGALVGFLFAPQIHLGSLYSTPELALIAGNVFSYIVSPKQKLLLTLRRKIQVAPTIYDFVFQADRKMAFRPGQYLEWTLGHKHPDSRGNRRYFTIASSPTEDDIRMGLKFYDKPSSFKRTMGEMQAGSTIAAGQLAGDFVLPQDADRKLVFIAGGIGITPFRSMLKYLVDKNERRDIILFYSNRNVADIVYTDIFDEAVERLGLRMVYTLTDPGAPPQWRGRTGFVDAKMIEEEAPDYKERMFYLSGPHAMVSAFEQTLAKMGLPNSQVKVDFFPGFV